MIKPLCTISILEGEEVVVLKVEGHATLNQSEAIRRVGESLAAGRGASLRIDLADCSYMDSTFLGTILYLARLLKERGTGTLSLLAPSAACRRILQQMGVEPLLGVLEEQASAGAGWRILRTEEENAVAFKRTVVEAHQELGKLPGAAGAEFRAVAESLAAELKAEEDA